MDIFFDLLTCFPNGFKYFKVEKFPNTCSGHSIKARWFVNENMFSCKKQVIYLYFAENEKNILPSN